VLKTTYTKDSYNRAIQRACEVAFGMPKELRNVSKKLPEIERERLLAMAAKWRAANCWSPNQLRHSKGTEVRREFGLEAAQVILGHAKADVTQIYAERDSKLGAEVARRVHSTGVDTVHHPALCVDCGVFGQTDHIEDGQADAGGPGSGWWDC
jgi:integrase